MIYCRAVNHIPWATGLFIRTAGVMSVLVACERQRSVMGQRQGISDQSRLLSYLYILAMVTFLSKFYVRKKNLDNFWELDFLKIQFQ